MTMPSASREKRRRSSHATLDQVVHSKLKRCKPPLLDDANERTFQRCQNQTKGGQADATTEQQEHVSIQACHDLLREAEAALGSPKEFVKRTSLLWKTLAMFRSKNNLVFKYRRASTETDPESDFESITHLNEQFVDLLKRSLQTTSSETIAKQVITLLLDTIRVECKIRIAQPVNPKASFPLQLLDVFVKELVSASSKIFPTVVQVFQDHIIGPFEDLRYYTLLSLEKLIERTWEDSKSTAQPVEKEKSTTPVVTTPMSCRTNTAYRVFCLLETFPTPKEVEALAADAPDGECASKQKNETRRQQFTPEGVTRRKSSNPKAYRNVFCSCWLAYLRLDHQQLDLPSSVYGELLTLLPVRLLPFLEAPLVLAKFFLTAFHHGDIAVAVRSLSGLFFLLMKARLAEPQLIQATGIDFYERLLELLQPRVFSLPIRARFLRLLHMALKSRLLPTHMRALFVKKLVSVSLLVPPNSALWLLALAARILQSGGSATVGALITNPDLVVALRNRDPLEPLDDTLDPEVMPVSSISSLGIPWSKRLSGWCNPSALRGAEPSNGLSDDTEMAPKHDQQSRSDLLSRMSLWELKLASMHWYSSVAQIAGLFNSDMFNPTAVKLDPDSFLVMDAVGLLAHSFKALLKRKSTPQCIRLLQCNPPFLEPDAVATSFMRLGGQMMRTPTNAL